MTGLDADQRRAFDDAGWLLVEDAVSGRQLSALQEAFAAWVEDSRSQDKAYGEMVDGRPRFDLEPGHSADAPALRRVSAPTDLSEAYWDAVVNSRMADCAEALVGPDVRHHHCKINSKLPGAATAVDWHQDFTFEPHSNWDLVTVLLFMDDVTPENGPLEVAPGSHLGPLHSLWHDGRFTAAVSPEVAERCKRDAVRCVGPAGAACLMHTRLLHGSTANLSTRPRTLFITIYAAADSMPLSPNPVPSRHAGSIIRGREPGRVRCAPYEMDLPEYPKGASFFVQQQAAE